MDLSKCPWCGALASRMSPPDQFAVWECHSHKQTGGEPCQSDLCRIAVLTKERDEARARLAVKCEHPSGGKCALLWQEDANQRQLAAVDPALCAEFPFGPDTVEHLAGALVEARRDRDELRRERAEATKAILSP